MKKAYWLIAALTVLFMSSPVLGQDLVINEIFYDEDGSDDDSTFTEIKGPDGFDLEGYVLAGVNGNGGAVYRTVPLMGTIPADGYFVVAQSDLVPEADQIDPGVDWQNGADQVQLWLVTAVQDTILIDSICYGGTADLNCEGGAPGPDVAPDKSISRCPDGQDTNNNEDDTAESNPTPGATNDCEVIPPMEVTVCEMMVVNENGFPELYGELVHLVNPVVLLNDNLTFSSGRLEVYVTDGECCTELYDYNFPNPYVAGQTFDVTGRVDFYNGKTELTDLTLVDLGMSDVPEPLEVSTGDFANQADPDMGDYVEEYEACLLKFCHLEIVEGTWPDEGSNALLMVDDGSGPAGLWIDLDTDIDGSPAPPQPFAAVGLGGQYDTESPYFDGYQLIPRGLDDIQDDCVPTAVEKTTWGRIKSRYSE